MIRSIPLLVALLAINPCLFSQNAIDVTEQTIKVPGLDEQRLLFGFATGDKIVFSFQEVDNKEVKEVEIIEYPSNSKYSDYKSKKIDKTLSVAKQGVYIFRFKNTALGGRICKIKIQRIPASETTAQFNTDVKWVKQYDTTWNIYNKDVVIGYDTLRTRITRKTLVKVDTIFTPLFEKTLRVHSQTNDNPSTTYADVNLPQNTADNLLNPYYTKEVVGWSYWLGVGQQSIQEYERANKKLTTGIRLIGTLTGYGVLANLLATGASVLNTPTMGDNVRYKFFGYQNNQPIVIDYGNVIAASARNENIKQGSFRLELYNDNFSRGIDVNVKMLVMQVARTWKDMPYIQTKITPRYEKQTIKEPVINSRTMAIAGS